MAGERHRQEIGAPPGTIPRGKIGGGGPWDLVNRFDAIFVAEGRKHNVPPAMLKSMMIVETGGKNVSDPFGATGVMQIKPRFWRDRALEAGYDLDTDEGQIGMAAAILGGNVPGVRGDDPTERFLYTYYPVLNRDGTVCYDCRGESGHTPRMYLEDIAFFTRLIQEAAGQDDGGLPPGATPLRRIDVAGFTGPVWLQEDIAFRQLITPLDAEVRPNDPRGGANRSGLRLRAEGTRYHETNNRKRGMGAAAHAQWQFDGTPGHPDGRIGVHFYVDDTEVVQTLPVNEQGVHSGDHGNRVHIAVEQCVNSDADLDRARRNAICLHAALLRDVIGTTATAAMWRHHDGFACPHSINADGTWAEVEAETDRLILQGTGLHQDQPAIVAEAGVLVAVRGALARPAPRRGGGPGRRLSVGQQLTTDGFTDQGQPIAGTARWFRLAEGQEWVHASGGIYQPTSGAIAGFTAQAGQLTVGARLASVRPGPSRGSGDPLRTLAAGVVVAVDGFTDEGQEIEGSPRWFRLAGNGGWVHSSGGTVVAE